MARAANGDDAKPGKEARNVVIEFSDAPLLPADESTPTRGLETKDLNVSTPVQFDHPRKDTEPLPKQIANRYDVEKLLGEGGQAKVYLAKDTVLGRQVAIKVSKPKHLLSLQEQQQFRQEARAIVGLDEHPGIAKVYDFGIQDDGRCFIVLKYLSGRSLKDCFRDPEKRQDFTVERTVKLMSRIAEALDYAHRQRVYHRDLKPGNILLDEDGNPHITDFGLAVTDESQRGLKGQVVGTAPYMSPEQVRGESHWVNGQADIWALGVILYELLAGKRPFQGEGEELNEEILGRTPTPLRQFNDKVPLELEQVVAKCLAKSESARYSTARDVVVALSLSLAQAKTLETPKTSAFRHVATGMALLAGIGLLIMAGYFLTYGTVVSGIGDVEPSRPSDLPEKNSPLDSHPGPSRTVASPPTSVAGILSSRPRPLFFDASPDEEPIHNGARQELWFPRFHGSGLWTLGKIEDANQEFTFSVDIEQVPWAGGIGLFFGYRPLENSGDQRIYQLISLEPKILSSELRTFSLKRTCVVRRASGKQDVVAMETVDSEEVSRPDIGNLRLVIAGKQGKITEITFGKRIFHSLAYDNLECSLGTLKYDGDFGLYLNSSGVDAGYGRFRDAIFHQPQ